MISGSAAPKHRCRCCAVTPRSATAPNRGAANAGSQLGSRPPPWASTYAVVTDLRNGSAEWLYDTLYCTRGQAENLIKLHKSQLASDPTSRPSALANQVRLVLHTAAYWLMLMVRDAIPKPQPLPYGAAINRAQRSESWPYHGALNKLG